MAKKSEIDSLKIKEQRFESLTVSAREAAQIIGVGKTFFYQIVNDGRLGPVPVLGNRYDRQEIIDWVREGQCCCREQWLQRRGIIS